MARVRVENLHKRFGRTLALQGVSFEVADGEFLCLLGPPGVGKTTTLRIIAGLEKPDRGEVFLDDAPVTAVAPQERDVAMVFEDVALYPHWDGYDNLAHPLKLRRLPREEIDARVRTVAEMLHISHLLHRLPGTYSGGERRRVAIGRALVRRPRVLLLDQPLTDLDARIRQEMTAELKRLQRETGQTMIYATHDYEEAVTMADHILVMKEGAIEQLGGPEEIYEQPQSTFVATIVGSPAMNLLPCRAQWNAQHLHLSHPAFELTLTAPPLAAQPAEVWLGVRPEHVLVSLGEEGEGISGTVEIIQPLGKEQIVELRLRDGTSIKVVCRADIELRRGSTVRLRFPPEYMALFDAATGRRLG